MFSHPKETLIIFQKKRNENIEYIKEKKLDKIAASFLKKKICGKKSSTYGLSKLIQFV